MGPATTEGAARHTGAVRPRRIPRRTCIACRAGDAKRALLRVVRVADGSVRLDLSGKVSGRGSYLCANASCWQAALNRGLLPRALKIQQLSEADRAVLADYAQQLPAPGSGTPEPEAANAHA